MQRHYIYVLWTYVELFLCQYQLYISVHNNPVRSKDCLRAMLNILKPLYIVLALKVLFILKCLLQLNLSNCSFCWEEQVPWNNLHMAIPQLFLKMCQRRHHKYTHFPLYAQAREDGWTVQFRVTSLNTLIIIRNTCTADTSEGCLLLSLWCLALQSNLIGS